MANLSETPPESCLFSLMLLLRFDTDVHPDTPCAVAVTLAARLCQPRRQGVQRCELGTSTQGRLDRARRLLQDAAAGGWNQAKDEEAWALLSEEWEWVGKVPYVRHLLVGWAAELGAASPEQAATDVLAAISQELMPLLRMRTYTLSEPTPAALAQASLRQGVTETSGQSLSTWQELALLLAYQEALDPRQPLACCTRILASPGLPAVLRPSLVAFYLHQFGRYCDVESWHSEDDIALLTQYSDQLERLAQDGEPSLGLITARGRAQRLLGKALLAQQVRLAAIEVVFVRLAGQPKIRLALTHLWRALALGDDGVAAEITRLGSIHHALSTLEQKVRAPAKLAYVRSLQGQFVAAQDDAAAFLSSTEGLNLRSQRLAAEAAGEAQLLPLSEALRQLLAPPPAAAVPAPPVRRALWLTWALSPRDAVYKAAAALGVLALLHGSTLGMFENWRAAAAKRRYDKVLTSVRMQDNDATIQAANAFLSAAAPRDVRATQVLELLDRAVSVEALQRGQSGRGAQVAALLKVHQDIRKHWSNKGGH